MLLKRMLLFNIVVIVAAWWKVQVQVVKSASGGDVRAGADWAAW